MRKLLIMGLPGAGKTTLANASAPRLNAVVFNADEVRANINKDHRWFPNSTFHPRSAWEATKLLPAQLVRTGDFFGWQTKITRPDDLRAR